MSSFETGPSIKMLENNEHILTKTHLMEQIIALVLFDKHSLIKLSFRHFNIYIKIHFYREKTLNFQFHLISIGNCVEIEKMLDGLVGKITF